MIEDQQIREFTAIEPTEENGYCIFSQDLENNDLVLFHLTKASSFESIINTGFLSARELGIGTLTSISFAKKSSSCFSNKGCEAHEDLIVFAVEFETLNNPGIRVEVSDVYVDDPNLQPKMIGYCKIPNGWRVN